MENIVIYARFSSHSQTEQSIEGQLQVCYEYAKRNNYQVIHEYIDRALTGTSDKRPEFQQMIEDSKNKNFKYVLVYQLDRFARDRYDSATYKHRLKKNGVRVISAKENISADASGILMESVLEGMAEYYSAELAQKIRRGMKLNAEKCKYTGGPRVFGYSINENLNYEINQTESIWVKRIFEYYSIKKPIIEIIKILNSNNIKTTKGKPFNNGSICRILNNRKYLGEYQYDDVIVKDGIPRIIDDDLFYKCQELKKQRTHNTFSFKATVPYFLTGRLFCLECGSPIVGASANGRSKKYHYYRCNNNIKTGKCKLQSIPKDKLEISVVESVKYLLTDELITKIVDDALMKLNEESNNQNRLLELHKEFKETNNKINQFTELLIQSRNIDLIMDKIDELRNKASSIQKAIFNEEKQNINISKEELIKKFKRIRDYDYSQPNYIQMFIDSFVEAVYISKDKKIAVVLKLEYTSKNNTLVKRGKIANLKEGRRFFYGKILYRSREI